MLSIMILLFTPRSAGTLLHFGKLPLRQEGQEAASPIYWVACKEHIP